MMDKVLRWLIPAGFQDLLRAAKGGWEATTASRAVLARNEKFRDCHKDRKRCFILATGPSIRRQDLSLLKGETCIAVSNSFVHPLFEAISPEYYCVPKLSLPPYTVDDAIRWFTEMGKRIGRARVFLGLGDRQLVERHGLFPGRPVHYLAFGRSWKGVEAGGLDLTRPLPKVMSVPVMALQIAIFLGFKEIYLLGCDHDSMLQWGVSRHFYEEREHVVGGRPGMSEWTTIEDEARRLGVLWSQYQALRHWAEPRGIRICNATAGGLLNVFDRVVFESLFEQPGKPVLPPA